MQHVNDNQTNCAKCGGWLMLEQIEDVIDAFCLMCGSRTVAVDKVAVEPPSVKTDSGYGLIYCAVCETLATPLVPNALYCSKYCRTEWQWTR